MTLNGGEKIEIDTIQEDLPRFMTLKEAAQRLGVTTRTLKRYAKNKKNPFPIVYFSDQTARVPWEQFNFWIDYQMGGGEENG